MSEKKMVRRSVAVAIGIVILLIGIVGAASYYDPIVSDNNNTIRDKNSQIDSLNAQIYYLNGQLNYFNSIANSLNNTVNNLKDIIGSLNQNLTNLQKIVNMQQSTVIYDGIVPNPSFFDGHPFPILQGNIPDGSLDAPPIHTDYAGYIVVNIVNSTSNSTFVWYFYSSNGFTFNSTISIGSSGSVCFPILPTTTLSIFISNADHSNLNITRVLVTYYY
jgi:hypothetical protein